MKSYTKIEIAPHQTDLNKSIRIAIGHITVNTGDIKKSYLQSPNVSAQRLKKLSRLLNNVHTHGIRHPSHRIQLLVLPEVSIPHSWANFITKWAREHQIGIICGLEHRIDQNQRAWNQLLAALPYRSQRGAKACIPVRRLKRHYSPEEEFTLVNHGFKIPDSESKRRYQLFQWRGVSFAVYNCYELASLEDRALFKAKVDFIVCSEFNPDVNYFSNVVESAARDLHCFVVQVNSAHFGDSRIVSPSKTELLNPLRLKGGDNQTFLTMDLPLEKLRDHQRQEYGLQKQSDDYKPTPPSFGKKYVKARIKLGVQKSVRS